VVMGFDGDLDQLTPTDDHKENLKRSVLFHTYTSLKYTIVANNAVS
jgi:hypothetical protein